MPDEEAGPRMEAVMDTFLKECAKLDFIEFDVAALHRAFGNVARTLRSMRRVTSPELWILNFHFQPGNGHYQILDYEIADLKRMGVLGIEWDGEMEKLTFHKDALSLLEKKLKSLPRLSARSEDFLNNLCRKSALLYKGLRNPDCY